MASFGTDCFDDDFEFSGDFNPSVKNLGTDAGSIPFSGSKNRMDEPVLVRLSDLAQYNISVKDIQASGMVFNSDHQKWEETEKCGDIDLTGFDSSKCSNCSWDEEFGFTSAGDTTPRALASIKSPPRGKKFIEDDEISDLCMKPTHDAGEDEKPLNIGGNEPSLVIVKLTEDDGDVMDGFSDDDEKVELPPKLQFQSQHRVSALLKAQSENYDDDFELDDNDEDMTGFSEDSGGQEVPPTTADIFTRGKPSSTKTQIQSAMPVGTLQLQSHQATNKYKEEEENYDDDFDDDFTSGDLSSTLTKSSPSDDRSDRKVGEFLRNFFKMNSGDDEAFGDEATDIPKKSGAGPRLIKPEDLQSLIAKGGINLSTKSGDTCSEDRLSDIHSMTHSHNSTGGRGSGTPSCAWDGVSEVTEGTDVVENWDDMFEGDMKMETIQDLLQLPVANSFLRSASPKPPPSSSTSSTMKGKSATAHGVLNESSAPNAISGSVSIVPPQLPRRSTSAGKSLKKSSSKKVPGPSKKIRLITPNDVSLASPKLSAVAKKSSDRSVSSCGKPPASGTSPSASEDELLMRFDSVQQKWVNRVDIDAPPLDDIDWGDDEDPSPVEHSGTGGSIKDDTKSVQQLSSCAAGESPPSLVSEKSPGTSPSSKAGKVDMFNFIERDRSVSDDKLYHNPPPASVSSASHDVTHERVSSASDFVVDVLAIRESASQHEVFMRSFLQDAFDQLMLGEDKYLQTGGVSASKKGSQHPQQELRNQLKRSESSTSEASASSTTSATDKKKRRNRSRSRGRSKSKTRVETTSKKDDDEVEEEGIAGGDTLPRTPSMKHGHSTLNARSVMKSNTSNHTDGSSSAPNSPSKYAPSDADINKTSGLKSASPFSGKGESVGVGSVGGAKAESVIMHREKRSWQRQSESQPVVVPRAHPTSMTSGAQQSDRKSSRGVIDIRSRLKNASKERHHLLQQTNEITPDAAHQRGEEDRECDSGGGGVMRWKSVDSMELYDTPSSGLRTGKHTRKRSGSGDLTDLLLHDDNDDGEDSDLKYLLEDRKSSLDARKTSPLKQSQTTGPRGTTKEAKGNRLRVVKLGARKRHVFKDIWATYSGQC